MGHSYTSSLFHCVFSTKERRQIITPELTLALPRWHRPREPHEDLAVGGIEDHVHILLSIPGTLAVAKAIQVIKGGSSKWVHDTLPGMRTFAWQEGYGAFSIGISQIDPTTAYIQSQAEHHRRRSFQEEFLEFLKKHGIEYDPRYVWG
jgi:REP element-mobilizing transposase RayT